MDPTLPGCLKIVGLGATYAAERPVNLKNFEPVRILGEGRYGKAVLAYDSAADLNFAVKLIPVGPNPRYEDQFEEMMNEKLIMDKLAWRVCFAQCYFTALTQQYAWFCLKYYAGGSLYDLIENYSTAETKLGLKDAQSIIAEILTAVKELHSNHILHRDIKPDNLLIDDEGHIVLSDFGISITLDKRKPPEKQVSRESFASGYGHIAPEMTYSPASYSYPVDLYSVGKTIRDLCAEKNLDGTWSDENKSDVIDLEAVLTTDSPSERATIKTITKHRFFQGIRWEDVKAGKLDMKKFSPKEVVTQKPESNCDIDLGSLKSPTVVNRTLRTFCSYKRYREKIQKQ